MRKQETKQSIMSSTSAFWLPVPLQKGLLGLKSKAWGGTLACEKNRRCWRLSQPKSEVQTFRSMTMDCTRRKIVE